MSSNTFTRKRRSLMSLEGWRDLVSDSMSIDIGSTSVIIAVRGRGVVVDEPAGGAGNKIAGVSVEDKKASAVVDIGGGTTNVAVVARGMIVYAQAERVGSLDIDDAIVNRLRRHHGLIIGALTAEQLKKELGSAVEPPNPALSM